MSHSSDITMHWKPFVVLIFNVACILLLVGLPAFLVPMELTDEDCPCSTNPRSDFYAATTTVRSEKEKRKKEERKSA